MSGHVTIFVDCLRDGKVIRTYDFLCPATLAKPPVLPSNDHLIEEAKTNLSNEGLAMPPFAGITFATHR